MAKGTAKARIEVASVSLLCPEAIERFDEILTRESIVYEQGAGGSTRWIAERVKHLVSVEHSPEWFKAVSEAIEGLDNVRLELIPLEERDENSLSTYTHFITRFPDSFFNVVFIDGYDDNRLPCTRLALDKVCPCGYITVDDTNWAKLRRPLFTLFQEAGWSIEEIHGQKIHPKTKKVIWTRTAFFQKPV